MRALVCLSLIACGARTELGAPGFSDAGGPCAFPDITATIRTTTDDTAMLYVNGVLLDATGHAWTDPQQYSVSIHRDPGMKNAVAIRGSNLQNTSGRDRGVLLDMRFTTEAGEQTIATNAQWRLATSPQENWPETAFDDSSWQNAVSEGAYPEGPWGALLAPLGIDSSAAEWVWSYDSNEPANAKVVNEDVFLRRDFYIDASGHVTDAPSACD